MQILKKLFRYIDNMEDFEILDLSKFPRPLDLCKEGKFKQLFNLDDSLESKKMLICGYQPSDYLDEEKVSEGMSTCSKVTDEQLELAFSGYAQYKCKPKLYQPIHYAAAHGDLSAVCTLVEKYMCFPDPTTSESGYPVTPLVLACYYGHYQVAQYLVGIGCNCCNLLILASEVGSFYQPKVRFARDFKESINFVTAMGKDHLSIAKLILDHFECTNYPLSVFEMAILHGSFEDILYLSKFFNIKSILLDQMKKPILGLPGSLFTAIFNRNDCEMIEKLNLTFWCSCYF